MTFVGFRDRAAEARMLTANGACAQFGALCWRRRNGKIEIALVTSRGSGRWIIPKGWPIACAGGARSAAQEAYEEAGLIGDIADACLGVYTYAKGRRGQPERHFAVAVYPMEVDTELSAWPEARQRRRRWFRRGKAASLVFEPGLKRIIRAFDPRRVPDPGLEGDASVN